MVVEYWEKVFGPLTRLGVFDHDALKVKCVAAHNRDGVEPIKIDAALVLLGYAFNGDDAAACGDFDSALPL